jgi:transmembrane sensor
MSDIVRLKTQTQIDNEAAVWTWRLDSGELTDEERAQFEGWLCRDGRHRHAFDEFSRTWNALDQLSQQPQDDRIAALARSAHRPDPPGAVRPAPRGRKRYWEMAAAAVLVIAVGATLWLAQRPALRVVSTAVGQERHVALADGTKVTLNTNTLLAVRFTRERRDIFLRKGEAHFDVIHDSSRPFVVHAGDAVIRDVGTQFEVRLRTGQDVDVLVNEGRVEVRGLAARAGQDGSAGGWVRALSAGQQLLIAGPVLNVVAVSPRQIDNDLAWRSGALVFQGEPLSQAIAEVGRYTRTRIVLTGPQVASLRISGRFRIDDVPGFLQALQEALPVRVSKAAPNLIYIAAR